MRYELCATFSSRCIIFTSFFYRNIPGIALYMTSLTQLRAYMAQSPYFALVKEYPDGQALNRNTSVLPTLSMQGNLVAGATTRGAVGFLLNPFSVLKARYEVRVSFILRKYINIIVALTSTEQHLQLSKSACCNCVHRTPRSLRTPSRISSFLSA